MFTAVLARHPAGKWVRDGAADVAALLSRPPHVAPFVGPAKPVFTVKRLIDVFLYTQYAHQPDDAAARVSSANASSRWGMIGQY